MKHLILYTSLLVSITLPAQEQTVGLFDFQADTYGGYLLFSPFQATGTYLIDNCGELVHKWDSEFMPAAAVILLENGNIMRTATKGVATNPAFAFGGGGERIQEIDWNSQVVWEYIYSDSSHRMHHDFVELPNKNLLIPAWGLKTKEEAILAGRDSTLLPDGVLWAEYIIEVDRTTSEIVWEWHMWDHLIQEFDSTKNNYGVIKEHPELFDINRTGGLTAEGGKNWLHVNAIDYNENLDQILINSFFVSEFFIIDHSTTTAQAAMHSGGDRNLGGDLLYRWGNPQNYEHGTKEDRVIFGSHNPRWIKHGHIDAGKIMYFNNGNSRPSGSYSSVDIIEPLLNDDSTGQYVYQTGTAYAPRQPSWSYSEPGVFYSNFLSGAQRLSNGNTLICAGATGRFFEINPSKQVVWDYVNPVTGSGIITQEDTIPANGGRNANIVFRCAKYDTDYLGLAGRDLTASDPIELNFADPYECPLSTDVSHITAPRPKIFPNPASTYLRIQLLENDPVEIQIFNSLGALNSNRVIKGQTDIDVSSFAPGIYYISLGSRGVKKLMIN